MLRHLKTGQFGTQQQRTAKRLSKKMEGPTVEEVLSLDTHMHENYDLFLKSSCSPRLLHSDGMWADKSGQVRARRSLKSPKHSHQGAEEILRKSH